MVMAKYEPVSAFTKRMEEFLEEIRAERSGSSPVSVADMASQELSATPTAQRDPGLIRDRAEEIGRVISRSPTSTPQVPEELSASIPQSSPGTSNAAFTQFLQQGQRDRAIRDANLERQRYGQAFNTSYTPYQPQPVTQPITPVAPSLPESITKRPITVLPEQNQTMENALMPSFMNPDYPDQKPGVQVNTAMTTPILRSIGGGGGVTPTPQPTAAASLSQRQGGGNDPISNLINGSAAIVEKFGMSWNQQHGIEEWNPGIDIAGEIGDPVKAVAGGTVALARHIRGLGNTVIIDSGDGYIQMYAQLNNLGVQEGQQITNGALIGQLGDTGLTNVPALHFEVRQGEEAVEIDPTKWLQQRYSGNNTGGAF